MPINLDLPKKPGLFITGTETAVGKTLIAGAIAKILKDQGLKVGVFKPIATGARRQWDGLLGDDAQFLANCANSELPLSAINPVAYITQATVVVGAAHEGRPVSFQTIAAAYKQVCEDSDVVIVEGVGGVREPLDMQFDLLDLAVEFNLPMVIVTHCEPGTVNQTLMTIDCIGAAKLKIAGVVVNYCDATKETAAGNTAPAVIAQFGGVDILAAVPLDETADVSEMNLGETILGALSNSDWKKLAGL